jgi:hypothetical protein
MKFEHIDCEQPKPNPEKGQSLNPSHLKGIIIILIISLASTFAYIGYHNQEKQNTATKTTQTGPTYAVVIQSNQAKYSSTNTFIGFDALIRLLTDDATNGLKKGDIADYLILTNDTDTNKGYLLQGTTSNNQGPVFQVTVGTQFFTEFVNSGDNVLIKAELMGSDDILFEAYNLGEYDITSLRATVNGTRLPFDFGVSGDYPIKPSWQYDGEASTTWYDPAEMKTEGVHLEINHSYAVHLEVGLSDGSRKVVDEVVPYEGLGAVGSIAGGSVIDHLSIDLLQANGVYGGSVVSVSFRNTWGRSDSDSETSMTITKVELFVNGVPVPPATCYLEVGNSWVESTRTPDLAYQGSVYKVTILLTASDGSTFTTSQNVTCLPF